LTKGIGEGVFRLWPMENGFWQEPGEITVEENATLDSLVTRLKNSLSSLSSGIRESEGDPAEHLALLVRWYHSSWRDGQWYSRRPDSKINFRRLSKDILKMVRPGQSL